jgi:hypothetical protein
VLEVHVFFLDSCHCLLVNALLLDSCNCPKAHVPHLDLGVVPLLRKKVDNVPFVVPMVARHLSP